MNGWLREGTVQAPDSRTKIATNATLRLYLRSSHVYDPDEHDTKCCFFVSRVLWETFRLLFLVRGELYVTRFDQQMQAQMMLRKDGPCKQGSLGLCSHPSQLWVHSCKQREPAFGPKSRSCYRRLLPSHLSIPDVHDPRSLYIFSSAGDCMCICSRESNLERNDEKEALLQLLTARPV